MSSSVVNAEKYITTSRMMVKCGTESKAHHRLWPITSPLTTSAPSPVVKLENWVKAQDHYHKLKSHTLIRSFTH